MDGLSWVAFWVGTVVGVLMMTSLLVMLVFVGEWRRKWRYKRGLIDSILAYERRPGRKWPQR
jgi:integral membrane sensor domain MASE1